MEGVGDPSLHKWAVVELMVVVVVGVQGHNSSIMVVLLSTKPGEEEHHHLKEFVEVMEVVVAVVAVEDLKWLHPDRKFPSCTKQPRLHIKPG